MPAKRSRFFAAPTGEGAGSTSALLSRARVPQDAATASTAPAATSFSKLGSGRAQLLLDDSDESPPPLAPALARAAGGTPPKTSIGGVGDAGIAVCTINAGGSTPTRRPGVAAAVATDPASVEPPTKVRRTSNASAPKAAGSSLGAAFARGARQPAAASAQASVDSKLGKHAGAQPSTTPLPTRAATNAAPVEVASKQTPVKEVSAKPPVAPPVAEKAAAKAPVAATAPAKSPAKTSAKASDAAPPGLPLHGVTMCFTGELDQMTRQDAEEKAKAAGAKVMGSVSGNTNYLVLGSHLDDGRKVEETSKYRKYMELKGKGKKCPELLTEAEFLAKLPGSQPQAAAAVVVATPGSSSTASCSASGTAGEAYPQSGGQPSASGSTSLALRCSWVDSYRPSSFDQLVGNASVIRRSHMLPTDIA